ncbi:hypothetical protein B4102_3297 [Heyndrickxia sporothermodurans]|uniref:Uncharacterized protein n=1 Tax=Heyndrickxia sporothermodurans TaxID=46224 RepID=A0A150KW45_9BACI|nr:4'-phosphopantetheinyl transferase superfamily protein [Heyndrickxia sporothermodurans]KYD04317.1 hypothetical protein B4102_3297 [Heyndrickxia sporothermodurans]
MVKEFDICAIKIPDNKNLKSFSMLMQNISVEKKNKILKFHKVDDALRSLFGDILLRTMLCNYGGYKNKDLHFNHNSYGKPYFSSNNRLMFNVSHSGDWVVSVVHHSQIGVDIEKIKKIDHLGLSKRYFSPQEFFDINNTPKENQLHYFYNLWTLKESFIKNIGCGLSKDLSSFTISKSEDMFYVLNNEKDKLPKYKFLQYKIDDGYICSVCVKEDNPHSPSYIKIYDSDVLIDEFLKLT